MMPPFFMQGKNWRGAEMSGENSERTRRDTQENRAKLWAFLEIMETVNGGIACV
jgi:hypothetical protein